jgi:TPR repeat protein
MTYYGKAADRGHIGAMNALGFAYRDGATGTKDLEKARTYFDKAAAKGNPVGLYEVATMYEAGNPVSKDLMKAHLYYNLASARQHPQAGEALQRISAVLAPEEIEKAQAQARAWKAAD